MTGPQPLRPIELRDHTTDAPRPKTAHWAVGDIVQRGSVRWCIRMITRQTVELEAMNAPAGIWWTTTLDQLPDKAAA